MPSMMPGTESRADLCGVDGAWRGRGGTDEVTRACTLPPVAASMISETHLDVCSVCRPQAGPRPALHQPGPALRGCRVGELLPAGLGRRSQDPAPFSEAQAWVRG